MYDILHIQIIVCCHHLKQRNDRTYLLEELYLTNCFLCMIKLYHHPTPSQPPTPNPEYTYIYYIYMQVLLD